MRLFNQKRNLLFLSLLLVAPLFTGCKKDRLSVNTYQFSITPSATAVAINNARTFVATGQAANGSFDIEPVWSVLNSTSGASGAVIVPPIGAVVDVTFPSAGIYTLVAEFEDKRATAQVLVANSTGPTTQFPLDTLPIYTDAGIPAGANLFTNMGAAIMEQIGVFDAPEGSNYMRAQNVTLHFWMVDLAPSSADLSEYTGGALKFYVRLSRPLAMGEVLKIEMEKSGGSKIGVTSNAFWTGFSSSSTDWQSVSLDLSLFFAGIGVVRSPFIFSTIMGSPLTVDIDGVRWEKP